MTTIVSRVADWRRLRRGLSGAVGFVPTMGNLHAGHIDLCHRSVAENAVTVASIFVNPTQFNQRADFEKYQRTLDNDIKLLAEAGVDYAFVPDEADIYPTGYTVQVSETDISTVLEGVFRPGHFTGMLTVVLKLLNIIQADRAYFGEKDYQQLLLVRRMVESLFVPTEIIACPTRREESGLAMSSRNNRLSAEQRNKAADIYKALVSPDGDAVIAARLGEQGFKVEYVESRWGRRLAAVWLDDVRLIDNVDLSEQKKG